MLKTTTCAWSICDADVTDAGICVRSNARLPGRNDGNQNAPSFDRSNSNIGLASPPAAGTANTPVVVPVPANTIVSLSPQFKPLGLPTNLQIATDGPPETETFLNSPCVKNAIHWPSGENTGSRTAPTPSDRASS